MHITAEEKKRFELFEKLLRYRFKKRVHLKCALTHKSFANEQRLSPLEHNERYEFLGDAVLELAVSHILMEQFPEHAEGDLSKLRAAIVNEEQLANLARNIELGNFLYLGKGEEQSGGREKPSILSDAFEALLGAIYFDRGFLKAFEVIRYHYDSLLQEMEGVEFVKDYKTQLQEVSQSRYRSIPRYLLVQTSGPDHQKTFEVSLSLLGKEVSRGKGSSKKTAEQDAAKKALLKMEGDNK